MPLMWLRKYISPPKIKNYNLCFPPKKGRHHRIRIMRNNRRIVMKHKCFNLTACLIIISNRITNLDESIIMNELFASMNRHLMSLPKRKWLMTINEHLTTPYHFSSPWDWYHSIQVDQYDLFCKTHQLVVGANTVQFLVLSSMEEWILTHSFWFYEQFFWLTESLNQDDEHLK